MYQSCEAKKSAWKHIFKLLHWTKPFFVPKTWSLFLILNPQNVRKRDAKLTKNPAEVMMCLLSSCPLWQCSLWPLAQEQNAWRVPHWAPRHSLHHRRCVLQRDALRLWGHTGQWEVGGLNWWVEKQGALRSAGREQRVRFRSEGWQEAAQRCSHNKLKYPNKLNKLVV